MSTCKRCHSTPCGSEYLFTAPCGCIFCTKCIIECYNYEASLCQEHRNTENNKQKRNCGSGSGIKRLRTSQDYYKHCACAANVYPCKFYHLGCDFKASPMEIEKHQTDVEAHLGLSVTKQQTDSSKVQLEETLGKQCSEVEKTLMELNNKFESYKEKDNGELNKQKQLLEKYNDDLKCLLQKYKEELNSNIKKLEMKVGEIEFPHAKHSHTYVWKVEEFSRLQSQHRAGSKVKSPSFYTAPNGYQMRLEFFPNGYDTTQYYGNKGTHLSLFLTVMKGDWDGILKWPIKYTATLTLLAQYNKSEHKSFPMNSDAVRGGDSFAKPNTESNKAWGMAKFFLIDDLKPLYLVDDCLYVKLDINVN